LKKNNTAFLDTLAAAPLEDHLLGVICLLLKPRQPADELNSFRPITLHNCDVKLVMMILSARLKRPLDYLIDVMQSAFLRNRQITHNICHHLGLAARLRELGLPGYLVDTDQTKAYDKSHRQWLFTIMADMGFRVQGVVRWCRILKAGSAAKVRMNGVLSAAFPVENGLSQGSPVSVDEWAILFQPIMAYITTLQAQGRLPRIPLPSGAFIPPMAAYADDGSVLLSDPDMEGPEVLPAFQLNEQAGGAPLSVPKTGILHLAGPVTQGLDPALHEFHTRTGFRVLPNTGAHRHLGAPLSADPTAQSDFAFNRLPGAMRAAAAAWGQAQPLQGRIRSSVPGQYIYIYFFFQEGLLQVTSLDD